MYGAYGSNGINMNASCADANSNFHYFPCDTNSSCFRCMTSGEVIVEDKLCDCKFDCRDLTDEKFCTNTYTSCDAVKAKSFSNNPNEYTVMINREFDGRNQTICRIVNASDYPTNASCDWKVQVSNTSNVSDEKRADFLRMYYDWQKFDCSEPTCEDLRSIANCRDTCHYQFDQYAILEPYRALIVIGTIIGITAIVGNISVITVTLIKLYRARMRLPAEQKVTKIFFLSLSLSDVLVAISTVAVSIVLENARRGRFSNPADIEKPGNICNVIGSIYAIGSEQSVFTMLLITFSRVMGVARPFARIPVKTFVFVLSIAWIASIFLAVIPVFESYEDTFNNLIWQKEKPFFRVISYHQVQNLTRLLDDQRYVQCKPDGKWAGLLYLMKKHFNITETHRLGYYHMYEICLPNIYPVWAGESKYFSLGIFILNAFCFALMAAGYATIYRYRVQSVKRTQQATICEESQRLKTKIICILATDFICWVPLCVLGMATIIRHGHAPRLFDTLPATLISVLLVLPINSAVNPFIYSAAPGYLHEKFIKCFECEVKPCEVLDLQEAPQSSPTAVDNSGRDNT